VTAGEAAEIGERFGDADIVWLARDEQGRALVKQGRLDEGLRLVDEAFVAAASGELSPIVTGIVYCNTIAFCWDAFALRHACEWTDALSAWCARQPEMIAHNGLCLVHRAEIMQLEGAWGEALAEARRASDHFTRGVLNELARGKALYRQGELHRLRGELAAAEESYRAASKCGYEPQPGLALLRLAEGNAVEAGRAMRRVLAETDQPLTRSRLLPAHVEIMLAIGDIEEARRSCSNLEEIAEAHASEMLAALAAEPGRRWHRPRATHMRRSRTFAAHSRSGTTCPLRTKPRACELRSDWLVARCATRRPPYWSSRQHARSSCCSPHARIWLGSTCSSASLRCPARTD
jgi:tetratricopeptide (TPR) repeat protein